MLMHGCRTWGQSRFSYNLEKDRLSKRGSSALHFDNRWILGYLYSLPFDCSFCVGRRTDWRGGIIFSVGLLQTFC